MSLTHFHVHEHVMPTTHIREYPRALSSNDQEEELQLAIKQYTPKDSNRRNYQGITVIGAHANGFPKELYEPLWDDLFERLQADGIFINSIWIADVAHQGASGVLNEERIGNDPSWSDHPRDLFLMINHFRKHMKRPLIGVGHSMGGNNLINLSSMHPRLFTTLILIDPVAQRFPSTDIRNGPAAASVRRRDIWPSRKVAADKFRASPFYQKWDPRVLERWIEYGLRETPSSLYPEVAPASTPPVVSADPSTATVPPMKAEQRVTLTTSKHQELATFLRPNFASTAYPDPDREPNPLTHPDADLNSPPISPFYIPVITSTFPKLANLRPSVFYMFGDPAHGAYMSAPIIKADKLATTGTGLGGSGGVQKGRVSSVTFDGVGHLIPMEVVGKTADAAAGWLIPELRRWRQIEDEERREWAAVPKKQRAMLSDEVLGVMAGNWIEEAVRKGSKGKL